MVDELDVAVDVAAEVDDVVDDVVGAGVDDGGSGGVGQFASAGLNAVGDGVALEDLDDVVLVLALAVGDGVGVPT